MNARSTPRWHLALRVALGLLTLLLLAELGTRLVTGLQWRAKVHRFDEVAARYEGTRGYFPRVTVGHAVGEPGALPAPLVTEGGGIEVVPFAEVPESAFSQPPRFVEPQPDVVRIAFLGGSTTFDGYPQLAERVLADEFGADRIEVINMGIVAGNSATSLLTASRFFDDYQPHIVVLYHGFNDLVFYRTRAFASARFFLGLADWDAPAFGSGGGSRGLWSLLSGGEAGFDIGPFAESVIDEPMTNYWALHRSSWAAGRDLFVSTFAAPSYSELSEDERAYFDTSIEVLWPILEDTAWYSEHLDAYNDAVRRFVELSGAGLVDAAEAVRGGRETFRDNCHRTETGRLAHAEAAAEALRPAVARWLERGPGRPVGPAVPETQPLAPPPDGLPTEHPKDGTCMGGPCPEGACFVPGGPAIYGVDEEALQPLMDRLVRAIGFGGPIWYEATGPPCGSSCPRSAPIAPRSPRRAEPIASKPVRALRTRPGQRGPAMRRRSRRCSRPSWTPNDTARFETVGYPPTPSSTR